MWLIPSIRHLLTLAHVVDKTVKQFGRENSILTSFRGRSSVGRALAWHARGRGFDSLRLHFELVGKFMKSLANSNTTNR